MASITFTASATPARAVDGKETATSNAKVKLSVKPVLIGFSIVKVFPDVAGIIALLLETKFSVLSGHARIRLTKQSPRTAAYVNASYQHVSLVCNSSCDEF
jgi:hypothetical protein